MKFFHFIALVLLTVGTLAGASRARAQTPDAPTPPAEPKSPTICEIESSNFDADFSPGEATTNAPAELDEIDAKNEGFFDRWGGNLPLDYLVSSFEELSRKTGLRIGAANTMLFMQPMGGQSSRHGVAGDLDILSSWTLLGRGTADTGRFVLSGEYRYPMGSQPPSSLRGQMGTLVPPTNNFNDRGWVVRDLYWVQRLFNARLRLLIGRGNISDYVGAYWLQNVNNSFVNRHFSANPGVPFPSHGPLLGISVRPTDQCYLTLGAVNAYSRSIRAEVDTLFKEWDIFSFGEAGYTPTLPGLGAGRYAFGIWHMDARSQGNLPESWGLTFIVDQNLTKNLQVFARYAYSDGALTNIRQLGQIGLGYHGLLGRTDDLTGAAWSLALPVRGSSRNESVLEVFHRFQVTRNNQFSVGLQIIANPGNAASEETAGVFYARFRTSF